MLTHILEKTLNELYLLLSLQVTCQIFVQVTWKWKVLSNFKLMAQACLPQLRDIDQDFFFQINYKT